MRYRWLAVACILAFACVLGEETDDPEFYEDAEEQGPSDVVTLTDDNFQELVLDSSELWIVEFFAPWCGHCKNLAPEWEKAATSLKGKVNLGALDATVHSATASSYDVSGYPTIKVFGADKTKPEAYEGGRTHSAIVDYAETLLIVVTVDELTSNNALEACRENQICAIAFLPHILDTGAAGRRAYLDVLRAVAEKFKRRQRFLQFVWTEGFTHQTLEEAFRVGGAGYPALVMYNEKKKYFAGFLGSFSEAGISAALEALGKERWTPLSQDLPRLSTVPEWDGEDGKLPEEEHEEL